MTTTGTVGKQGKGAKYAQQHAHLALGQAHGLLQGQVVDLEYVNHVENGSARQAKNDHGEYMANGSLRGFGLGCRHWAGFNLHVISDPAAAIRQSKRPTCAIPL